MKSFTKQMEIELQRHSRTAVRSMLSGARQNALTIWYAHAPSIIGCSCICEAFSYIFSAAALHCTARALHCE